MTSDFTGWRTSTRSAQQGSCVEVGSAPGFAAVRDTKDRDGGSLIITTAAWTAFLNAVRADRLHP